MPPLPFEVEHLCGSVDLVLCVAQLKFKYMVLHKPISLEAVVFIPYVDVCQIMGSKLLLSLKILNQSCEAVVWFHLTC